MKTVYVEGIEFDQLFVQYSIPPCVKPSGNGYLVDVPDFEIASALELDLKIDDALNAKYTILAAQGAFDSWQFTGKTKLMENRKYIRTWKKTGPKLNGFETPPSAGAQLTGFDLLHFMCLAESHPDRELVFETEINRPALYYGVTGNAVMAESWLKTNGYPDAFASSPDWVMVHYLSDLQN